MNATGELDLGDMDVEVLGTEDHVLDERHLLSISIAERRKRFNTRRKLTRRTRAHARQLRLKRLAIGHLTSVYLNEVVNFDKDDGSDEFLKDELSSSAKAVEIRIPPYFDSRIMWGQECWYPLRDQKECGSCYAVSIVDTISNRACISAVYEETNIQSVDIEHMQAKAIHTDRKPPPLAVQPVIACARHAQARFEKLKTLIAQNDQCKGGVLKNVAEFIKAIGLIGEPIKPIDEIKPVDENVRPKGVNQCTHSNSSKCDRSYKCMELYDLKKTGLADRRLCPYVKNLDQAVESCDMECLKKTYRPDSDEKLIVKNMSFVGASVVGVNNKDKVQILSSPTQVSSLSRDLLQRYVSIIKTEIIQRGPVAATIDFNTTAYPEMIENKELEIYPLLKKANENELHSIKVIGWATIENQKGVPADVWIIQNSWGKKGAKCLLNNPNLTLYDAPAPTMTNDIDAFRTAHKINENRKKLIRYPTNPHVSESGYFFHPMYTEDELIGEKQLAHSQKKITIKLNPNVEFRTIAPKMKASDIADFSCGQTPRNVNSGESARHQSSSGSDSFEEKRAAQYSSAASGSISASKFPQPIVVILLVVGLILILVILYMRARRGRQVSQRSAAPEASHSGSRRS